MAWIGRNDRVRTVTAWARLVGLWAVHGAPDRATRDAFHAAISEAAPLEMHWWATLDRALAQFGIRLAWGVGHRVHAYSACRDVPLFGMHDLDPDEWTALQAGVEAILDDVPRSAGRAVARSVVADAA